MLQKIRPANSTTDHLLVGTERFQYFTAVWNSQTQQLDTVQTFVDVSERHMKDSQSLDRCLVDPTGQYIVMELFQGVLNLIKMLRPRKNTISYLDDPEQVRIVELYVLSSTFLFTESNKPKLALLYQDRDRPGRIRLATYRLVDERGQYGRFDPTKDREDDLGDLDPGACLLIPVPKGEEEQKRYIYRNQLAAKAQLGGVIIVGETRMTYLDDESKATVEAALDEASIFVAWERYDSTRYLLADDFGILHLLTLVVDGDIVTDIEVQKMGRISKPSAMVYLGEDLLFIGSHEADSQVVRLDMIGLTCMAMQTLQNIAPILDFAVMDMGGHTEGKYANAYSSGQARLVTGSGTYQDGTLRSVRSGVGLQDVGELGEIDNVRAMFSLKTTNEKADVLVMSFLSETRIFRFDAEGEVEELDEFLNMELEEQTLLAEDLPDGRILQVTSSKVLLLDTSGVVLSSWDCKGVITAASSNESFILVSTDGKSLTALDLNRDLHQVGQQEFNNQDQVSCVHVPMKGDVAIVGFWQSGSISVLSLPKLEGIQGELLRNEDSAAVPRSIVLTQILPEKQAGPTLLIAMSDGIVLTYTVDKDTYALSGKKGIVLGTQQAYFQVLAREDGIFNVFATSEHSSLIYGSEGRIVYSAITAEDAICVCSFDSEAYPNAIVIATAADVKISNIDTERRTHVRTLHVGQTVRRIAYSESEKVFGIGAIQKNLVDGVEMVSSSFRIVDEVMFAELGKPFQFDTNKTEIVESVIRAKLRNAHGDFEERFIVGTGFLDQQRSDGKSFGRIRIFGLSVDRSPYEIIKHDLKGACRRLEVVDGKIFAALIKTVVVFEYVESSKRSASLEKVASYRTSTVPIDLAIHDNIIAVADLMKSVSLVEFVPGKTSGEPPELIEVARHFQSYRTTAVSHIEGDSYLEADDEGNLTVLRRNRDGVTPEDRHRLEVTSEMNLGELVNKITKINVEPTADAIVVPKAFVVTVSSSFSSLSSKSLTYIQSEGSIYLFATIVQKSQDLLMRLQTSMAELVHSPGNIPFNRYRSFKNSERETEEPFRFVDGELIERFLDVSDELQLEICKGLGPGVEDVRNMVEELKRLH